MSTMQADLRTPRTLMTQVGGVNFSLGSNDVRKYPHLQMSLTDKRRAHVARAIKQNPLFTKSHPDLIYSVTAQPDACVDYGQGNGCGFVAIVSPLVQVDHLIGPLRTVECGHSLYKFTLRSLLASSPAQMHQEASEMVRKAFRLAAEGAIVREESFVASKSPACLDDQPEEDSPPPYAVPHERIECLSMKDSLRRFFDNMAKQTPAQIYQQGLLMPPVQTHISDGASWGYSVYALEDRPSEDTFYYMLSVDGGSIVAQHTLLNETCQGGRVLESQYPAFESMREYQDLARDAQAYVLLARIKQAIRQQCPEFDAGWVLELPERKYLRSGSHKMFFSDPTVVNHYNTLLSLNEAFTPGRSNLCPPGVLQLHKSIGNRADPELKIKAGLPELSASALAALGQLASPGGASSPMTVGTGMSATQAKRALREFSASQRALAQTSSDPLLYGSSSSSDDGGASSSRPGMRSVNGGYGNSRDFVFYHQSTCVNSSSGGLAVVDPCTRKMSLFVSQCKVGRDYLDVVRSSADALMAAGVLAPDRRTDMLPNIELVHIQGAFPRFFPTIDAVSQESAERELLRHDPSVILSPSANKGPESKSCANDLTNYLSGLPVMQPSVNRMDKIASTTHSYSFACLDYWIDNAQFMSEVRAEKEPWIRSLYQFFEFMKLDLGSDQESDYVGTLFSDPKERPAFLRAVVDYLAQYPCDMEDLLVGDHYTISTQLTSLIEIVRANCPTVEIQSSAGSGGGGGGGGSSSFTPAMPRYMQGPRGVGSHQQQYSARVTIEDCVISHYREGTPLPESLFQVIGNETLQLSRVLPQTLTMENMYRTLLSWAI